MKIAGFIPARMASTRFPGKPLAKICGTPMLEHVYRRARACTILDELYVATCDQEIAEAVKAFGAPVVMTHDRHPGCIDRVAEAYRNVGSDADIVVVIQGDEPLLRPEMIESSVGPLLDADGREIFCTNLTAPITSQREFEDPNEVKVVFDANMNALYYSREPIPSIKKTGLRGYWHKQVCVIAFWRETLRQFTQMPQTPLEKAESVDMLRVLENGLWVRCVVSPFVTCSVDTKADLRRVEEIMVRQ